MPPEYLLLDEHEYDIAELLEVDLEIEDAGDLITDDNQRIPIFRNDEDQWIVAPGYEDEAREIDFCNVFLFA